MTILEWDQDPRPRPDFCIVGDEFAWESEIFFELSKKLKTVIIFMEYSNVT